LYFPEGTVDGILKTAVVPEQLEAATIVDLPEETLTILTLQAVVIVNKVPVRVIAVDDAAEVVDAAVRLGLSAAEL
jgi:hypothetical protein